MKTFISIILTFFISVTYGQPDKIVTIPTYKNYKNEIDTSLWFQWKYKLAKQIDLKDLQISTDTFHFRLWTDIQAIDIWTFDYSLFFGAITNYAQRYDDNLLRKGVYRIGKIYSNQLQLDSAKARQIFNLIDKLSIVSIPSDDKISGWQQGFDGEEFLIETSTTKMYNFKTYWTPKIFVDSLKEAKQIQIFIDYLYTDLQIYKYYQSLKLPDGTYLRKGIQGIKIKSFNEYAPGATKVTDLL